MAVVWGTVQDHHGYIDVESVLGKGTRFDLYFPLTREKGEATQTIQQFDIMGQGESILVVDDIQSQRDVASAILRKLNYTVKMAASGEEAVTMLKQDPVDLVVMDMIMEPGIDGLQTYKMMLEINPYQRAIIASGFSETDRVKEAQSSGAGAYVKKPYTLEKIATAVRTELDRKP
jgi:CheY-like chemotaxis protein